MKRRSDPTNESQGYGNAESKIANGEKKMRLSNADLNILNELNTLQTAAQFSNMISTQLMSLQVPNMFNEYNLSNMAMQPSLLNPFNIPHPLPIQDDLHNSQIMGLGGMQLNPFSCNDIGQLTSLKESQERSKLSRSDMSNGFQINQVDPSSYLALEEKLKASTPPTNHSQGTTNRFQRLSRDIWAHYQENLQDPKIFCQKIELWGELERVLRKRFGATTHVFGSTLNGFGSAGSDMDICMFINRSQSNKKYNDSWDKDNFKLLSAVRKEIRRECGRFISGNIELVPAKIPILKFYDHHGKIEVDLSCNNQTSVRNTNLLFCYSQVDWRVRPLVLAVKDWAKAVGINEARFSTLSSYCLTLMVLHFLQAGVKDQVVPNLHELHPNVFNPESNIFDLPFTCDIEPSFKSKNKSSLGELLFGFFEYYTKDFDFTNHVGSIRAGNKLFSAECESYAKTNRISPGQWKAYVLMEEPFDRSNAGRAICKRDKFDLILKAFESAHAALDNAKNLKYLLEQNEVPE